MATTTYTISDLAREFDLTTRAMRFYEDMGLLQPERSGPGGRNRIYSARDRTRLKLTLRAKRLGLSLTEAARSSTCTTARATPGRSCSKFLAVLAQHRKQLEEQMADLQANLDEVQGARERGARPAGRVRETATGGLTGIIDVYVNVNSQDRHGRAALRTRRTPVSPRACAPASPPGRDAHHRRDAGRGRRRAAW